MLIFKLNRNFFDFYTQNKECKVYHIAMYYHLLQMSNSLGKGADWRGVFGLPTNDTMEALSIGNKNTYYDTLRDLEKWDFLTIVRLSPNVYQATIIKLNFFDFEKEILPLQISDSNHHAMIHATDYGKEHTMIHANNHAVVPIDIPLDLKTKDLKTKKEKKVKEWFFFDETIYNKNSELFEIDFLKAYPEYSKFLISHYHQAAQEWRKDSQADKFKKKDWLLTVKNWIDADVKKGWAKYSERQLNPNEKANVPVMSAEAIKAIRHI